MATGTTAANTVTARSRSRTIATTAAIPPPGLTRMRSPPLSARRSRRARAGRRPRRDPSPTGRESSSAPRRAGARRGRDEALRQDGREQAARSTDRRCARGARGAPRPPRLGAAVPGRARRLPKTPQLAIAGVGSGRQVGRARRLQLRAPERLTRSRPRGSGVPLRGGSSGRPLPRSYVLRHTFASNALAAQPASGRWSSRGDGNLARDDRADVWASRTRC